MRLKESFFLGLLANYALLYWLCGVSQQFSMEPARKFYFNSAGWKEYVKDFEENDEVYHIVTDNTYCDKVAAVRTLQKITEKYQRVIFSDYSPRNLVKEVLAANGKLILPDHHINSKNSLEDALLDPSITMFYHKTGWHVKQKIGKAFACPGQRYNHIPGNTHLVYKDLLAFHLKKYSDFYKDRKSCFDLSTFFPATYDLNSFSECQALLKVLKPTAEVKWIKKKSRNSHNAEGIEILYLNKTEKLILDLDDGKNCGYVHTEYLIQKYIENPLLVNNHKFDFRVYMVIANLDPLVVLYHDGFLRVTLNEYIKNSTDNSAHITNTAFAKDYLDTQVLTIVEREVAMEEQMWTYQQLEKYLESIGKVEKGWVKKILVEQMKQKMIHLTRIVYSELLPYNGLFELFGIDFLLDENLNLWLLEAIRSPAMMATSEVKGKIQKNIVEGLLDIEYALLYKDDFESAVEKTGFEFVYNGFKNGPEAFCGLLLEECI